MIVPSETEKLNITASAMYPRTDAIIQQTLKKEFEKCTVLTIAHRLHTIMDYDRIMVLSAGRLKEMDEPYTLLMRPKSLLSDMVSQVSKEQQHKLKQIALEGHKKNRQEHRQDRKEDRKHSRLMRIQHSSCQARKSSLSDRYIL